MTLDRFSLYAGGALLAALVTGVGCTSRSATRSRTVTVAQSAGADVTGAGSASLQRAANLLHPGDTLAIGPGTYQMDDSLVVPSGVTVRGTPGKTILLKSPGVESSLSEDGDYGESYLAVAQPQKFRPGMGVTVLDDAAPGDWDVSVSSVVAVHGSVLQLSRMTIRDYDLEKKHARIRNTFPVVCALNAENVVLEDLIVDGRKAENARLDGCRGGAIYLCNVRSVTVRRCVARNYNGDGISFQITDKVHVVDSEAYGNTGFGIHPGSGSARAAVENSRMHHNGDVGLFLCWRVRQGRFSGNTIEDNGRYGISIGHKDTDNEFEGNTIARNGEAGVLFRQETLLNSGHRNTLRHNRVLDNGGARAGYGFWFQPSAGDIVLEGNQIANTLPSRVQRYALYREEGAGSVRIDNQPMVGNAHD